ncbi:ATP-grasp domain-containing protein [Flavobacterium sp. MK4S-17]|uniref:ATP-grasp domain-containing protein n=1 Tax=Flavobacterium sp. MK4S-17 TaxID=2543737 RepID=UPI00135934BC|nr:ATP-grasp domain-containing protein [Flavobacterium sp. MK4S-17]
MNILVTSAGRRSYLIRYFQDILKGKGKVYASNSSPSLATQDADGSFISPLIYDDTYIDSLIEFCKSNDIKAIISVFDIDLLILAKNKENIESHGIKLLLSGENVIEICNDKWNTYLFLKNNNIGTPLTFKSKETAINAISSKEINFPVIIKPRWGMASMGIFIADNYEELNVFYNKSLKAINNSYLKYESSLTPEEMVLIQEKLKGQEYGLDVINDLKGNFVKVIPKSKLEMRAGETDLGQTISSDNFNSLGIKLSNLLKHEVILSVDCFEYNGEIKVIEMNCRISGHYPLSHIAGANLPKQIIEWLENKPTDMNNFNYKEGLFITKDLVPRVVNL